jgi:adenylosuccinate synthase
MSNAKIVIGTIWGDEGKGITTDFLCSKDPLDTIVVRFSGGQQAGHNVKIDGVNHVHSSFGSGTLRGVPSYFSHYCTLYPVTMYREALELYEKVHTIEYYTHPLINITTPADVAYNRLTAPQTNHGSCGLGVGATMKRNLESPYKVYGVDLKNKELLMQKVEGTFEYYKKVIGHDPPRIKRLKEMYEEELKYFVKYIDKIQFTFMDYDFLKKYNNIVFEGSQGILLDMDHGIFPNVTYANTTSKNAIEICKEIGVEDIEIYYVTRCYQTRHGNGWMSNEEEIKLINTEDEINKFNEWQKDFRVGEIDYELLNQSMRFDNLYSKGLPKNLVVTCLDQREDFTFEYDKLDMKFNRVYNSHSADSKDFVELTNKVLFPWP